MTIDSCYEEIRCYYTLRDKLVMIANALYTSSANLEPVGSTISTIYRVNDSETPIVSRCKVLKENTWGIADYLAQAIIPAIDVAISNKYNQIAFLQANENN